MSSRFGTARPARVAAAACRGEPGGREEVGAILARRSSCRAVADALPGVIESIAVQRPTLEDVFRHTGARL
jgi:hypothetical protein